MPQTHFITQSVYSYKYTMVCTFKCQLTNVNGFWPNKITTGNHKNCTIHASVQLGIKYEKGGILFI